MLSIVEHTRLHLAKNTEAEKKSRFGRFLTPERTAAFMAGLFPDASGSCHLLDAGAGIGSLSAAFLERWLSGGFHFRRVDLDAFEIDNSLHPYLSKTLEKYNNPNGFYCVVRRFSSKEEKRRIVASVVDPSAFGDVPVLGFENHLNLFHENKRGLPQVLAHGLTLFLNTTAVDENFRCFNGHTQVNATDLKRMKYPSRDTLIELGEWAAGCKELTQTMIDAKLETLAA